MPTFCRHGRLAANCPMCREPGPQERPRRREAAPKPGRTGAAKRPRAGGGSQVSVRKLARAADDGYRHDLVPGLRATADAERLADEIAFSAGRFRALKRDPPGLYAEAASATDEEERAWLAFLIAYLGPTEGAAPFAAIAAAHVPWASGELPALDGAELGARAAHDPARGTATILAYRAWAQRAGSQQAGLEGESAWAPAQRFARAYERLALPGLKRAARYDFLLSLGALGAVRAMPDSLMLTGAHDHAAAAAKRIFGIADPMLLERRAAELARACEVQVGMLDLALDNFEREPDSRATLGSPPDVSDSAASERARAALDV